MSRKVKILSVTIQHKVDDSPDKSWIGKYSNAAGDDDKTIDREERGDAGRGEYRYFIAANSGEETGNAASVEEDYKRMESYNRGDWCFYGIIAKAQVQLARHSTIQTIRSGGLWGVESDSGDDYLNEVADEELAHLRGELEAIGCTTKQIDAAFAKAERP